MYIQINPTSSQRQSAKVAGRRSPQPVDDQFGHTGGVVEVKYRQIRGFVAFDQNQVDIRSFDR